MPRPGWSRRNGRPSWTLKTSSRSKTGISRSHRPAQRHAECPCQSLEDGRCDGTERVYDGLRTSEITLHDLGTAVVEKDRPFSYEGEARVCGFTGRATGGHQRKSRWRNKERKPEDLLVFVAEVRPDLFIPVRMEAKSFLGKVTSRLVMPSLKYNRRDG